MNNFLFFFIILSIFSAFLVIFNTNIIISLLALIATFINSSILLILLGFEFFGLIFIAIYAGAIAVLFLFILMMINIPYIHMSRFFFYEIGIIILLGSLIYILVTYLSTMSILVPNFLYGNSLILFNHSYIDSLELISALLYTHYGVFVIFAGILLFVAMVGSIMVFAEYQFTLDFRRYNKINITKIYDKK